MSADAHIGKDLEAYYAFKGSLFDSAGELAPIRAETVAEVQAVVRRLYIVGEGWAIDVAPLVGCLAWIDKDPSKSALALAVQADDVIRTIKARWEIERIRPGDPQAAGRATIQPMKAVDEARFFIDCIEWVRSHWMTAQDLEERRDRALAGKDPDKCPYQYYRDKCVSYEKDRDDYWRRGRNSGFAIAGAAREWQLPSGEILAILNRFEPEHLPSVCGVVPETLPDFEPAIAEARQIQTEASIRAGMQKSGLTAEAPRAEQELTPKSNVADARHILAQPFAAFTEPSIEEVHDRAMDYIWSVRLLCRLDAGKSRSNWAEGVIAIMPAAEERRDKVGRSNMSPEALGEFAAVRSSPFRLNGKTYASAHAAALRLQFSVDLSAERTYPLLDRVLKHLPPNADFNGADGFRRHIFGQAMLPFLSGEPLDVHDAKALEKHWPGLAAKLAADPEIQVEADRLFRGEMHIKVPVGKEPTELKACNPTWLQYLQRTVSCDADALGAELEIEFAKVMRGSVREPTDMGLRQGVPQSSNSISIEGNLAANQQFFFAANQFLLLLQRLRVANRDTYAPMSGGGEEWHFDNPGDEYRVSAAQREMESLKKQLRDYLVDLQNNAVVSEDDLSTLREVFDYRPNHSAMLPEFIDCAEACLNEMLSQRQARLATEAIQTRAVVTATLQEPPDGFYSPTDIAKAMRNVGKAEAIRKALGRLMEDQQLPGAAWMENSNPAKGQAKILYRLSLVRPHLSRYEASAGA
jgi:hypothetical protein